MRGVSGRWGPCPWCLLTAPVPLLAQAAPFLRLLRRQMGLGVSLNWHLCVCVFGGSGVSVDDPEEVRACPGSRLGPRL